MDYNSRFNKAELTQEEIAVLSTDDIVKYTEIQCKKILAELPDPKET